MVKSLNLGKKLLEKILLAKLWLFLFNF